jgi:hypothetical protein
MGYEICNILGLGEPVGKSGSKGEMSLYPHVLMGILLGLPLVTGSWFPLWGNLYLL